MLTHKSIWAAIDALATEHGLSVSGLAKKAGLDPTTFNKSKRVSREGKPRWPSTESVAKILDATGSTLPDLVTHIARTGDGMRFSGRRIPLIAMNHASTSASFDEHGYPVSGWEDEMDFPDISDPHAFAMEITGDSMYPVLREGDYVIVSPQADPRRGDRIVVKSRHGDVMAKELVRRTANRIELRSINPGYPDFTLEADEVAWMSRIVWIGQQG